MVNIRYWGARYLFARKEQRREKHDNSLITWPTYLDGFSDHRAGLDISRSGPIISCIPSGPLRQVGLMSSALGVGKIIPFVIVQGQTKLAFVRSQVVAHKIRIFFQINRF